MGFSNSTGQIFRAVSVLAKIAPDSETFKNIVVLLAFQLVLLYYSILPKVVARNAFRCQDKNIDILEGNSPNMYFVVLPWLALRYTPQSRRGKHHAPQEAKKDLARTSAV
jgi:hypothetical protein